MSFVERGLKAIVHRNAEWDRQYADLSDLSPEELKSVLKKSVISGLIGDGGKYVILFGAFAISDKTPQAIVGVLVPLAVVGATIGISAESYFGIRTRAAKEILYERGVYTRPGVAVKELFQTLQALRRKNK